MVHMEKVNRLYICNEQTTLTPAPLPPFLNITELENYSNRKYIRSSNTANLSEQAFPLASVTFDSPYLSTGDFSVETNSGVKHLCAQPKSFPTKKLLWLMFQRIHFGKQPTNLGSSLQSIESFAGVCLPVYYLSQFCCLWEMGQACFP